MPDGKPNILVIWGDDIAQPEFLDDGPVKPARIWGRIGRRPILAAGNSNGDIQMLEYADAGTGPSLSIRGESLGAGRGLGLDGRQHQERLGQRVQ